MFKVNNKDTRTTPLSVVLVSLLLTFNIFHNFSIVDFEHVIAGWDSDRLNKELTIHKIWIPGLHLFVYIHYFPQK